MVSCDCCGKETDERSLQVIGKYFVCTNCYHGYTEDELIEKLEEKECRDDLTFKNIALSLNSHTRSQSLKDVQEEILTNPTVWPKTLREEFKEQSGKNAITAGLVNPDYMLWLEAKIRFSLFAKP